MARLCLLEESGNTCNGEALPWDADQTCLVRGRLQRQTHQPADVIFTFGAHDRWDLRVSRRINCVYFQHPGTHSPVFLSLKTLRGAEVAMLSRDIH